MILREGAAGYEEPIRQQLTAAMREAGVVEGLGERGGIHLRAAEQIGAPATAALRSAARVWLDGSAGSLSGALRIAEDVREPVPPFVPVAGAPSVPIAGLERRTDLAFDNGLGGFAPGRPDYVIQLDAGAHDAPALEQRDRQRPLRLRRHGGRRPASPGPATAARTG